MKNNNLKYPQPEAELKKVAEDIFIPVSKGLCISCFFISGTGKRVYLNFLLKEEKILKEIFGQDYNKTIFVYVDPDEIIGNNNEDYLNLIKDSLNLALSKKNIEVNENINGVSNPLLNIKETLTGLVEKNWHTVFILNDFEFTLNLSSTIFRNIESILSLNKRLVTFVFLATKNILDPDVSDRFQNLKYAINRVTYYYPMMNDAQVDYMLKQQSESIGLEFTDVIKQTLKKHFGGHVQMLKYSFTNLKNLSKEDLSSAKTIEAHLCNQEQLKTISRDIWNFFNDKEKEIISLVVRTGKINPDVLPQAQFLLKTNFIKKVGNKYQLFGECFTNFIQTTFPKDALIYEASTNQIYLGDQNCTKKFTLQEFKLLIHFIKNQNRVITRDEIGQILWGANYVEKFSDWSIDKIISVTRRKLSDLGFPQQNLVTLKKRGFSFSNSE